MPQRTRRAACRRWVYGSPGATTRWASALLLGFLVCPRLASANDLDRDAWLGPGQGDMELRGALGFSHAFSRGASDLAVQLDWGYFFLDSVEGGVGGSLGYTGQSKDPSVELSSGADLPETPRGVSALRQALSVDAIAPRTGGWYGTTNLWLRLFPFSMPEEPLLPRFVAPFIDFEFGPQYAQGLTPYLIWTSWLGANFYVTEQLALSPRVGYALIFVTDKDARDGDSVLEHALLTSLAFSVFLTP